MSDKKAQHLTDANFKKILDDNQLVFVDFYADWCGPCQMAAPIVDELAGEYEGKAVIAKVNIDENQQTASDHGVMSIPTVIIFKDGEEVDRKVGFPGKEGYQEMINRALE